MFELHSLGILFRILLDTERRPWLGFSAESKLACMCLPFASSLHLFMFHNYHCTVLGCSLLPGISITKNRSSFLLTKFFFPTKKVHIFSGNLWHNVAGPHPNSAMERNECVICFRFSPFILLSLWIIRTPKL